MILIHAVPPKARILIEKHGGQTLRLAFESGFAVGQSAQEILDLAVSSGLISQLQADEIKAALKI